MIIFSAINNFRSLLNNLTKVIRSLITNGFVDIKISVKKKFLFKIDFNEILDLIVSILIIFFLWIISAPIVFKLIPKLNKSNLALTSFNFNSISGSI